MTETALLVLARSAGFVFRAPGFSHPNVPPPVRAGFAFALAGVLAGGARTTRIPSGGLVFAVAAEALLGAAIGTAAAMLYDGAFAGGKLLDDYVGIRAGVPGLGLGPGSGLGRLWSLVFTTGYFTLGGYAIALEAFAHAFTTLPPGALVMSTDLQTFAVALPATLARAALLVAGPALILAAAAQFGLATVARLVPRFSAFTLAFPIVFGAVILMTIATVVELASIAGRPWFDLSTLHGR